MSKLLVGLIVTSFVAHAAAVFAGGAYVDNTFVGTAKSDILNNVEDNLNTAGWTTVNALFSGTYVSGGSISGSAGQTCTLNAFNNGLLLGSATVALTGSNTIANGTAIVITQPSSGATSAPTAATLSTGTATSCSGTATLSTIISAHHSTNILLLSNQAQSAYQIKIRLKDNGGNCVQVYMENTAFTLKPAVYGTQTGGNLLPGVGKTFRVLASRFQALVYTATTGNSREFVWFGMPYVSSFQTGSITAVGFLTTDSDTDVDATVRTNLRSFPTIAHQNANSPSYELMVNNNWWEISNSATSGTNILNGAPRLVVSGMNTDQASMTQGSPVSYRWFGANAILTGDVFLSWGATSKNDEAVLMGQVYDAVYIADAVAIDTTATFASHLWRNITNNWAGSGGGPPRGGIWFATN